MSLRVFYTSRRGLGPAPRRIWSKQTLLQLVEDELETETGTSPEGCECVVGEPGEVVSPEQIKKVSDGTYTACYRVRLVKYRTPGECMPAADELPEDARV